MADPNCPRCKGKGVIKEADGSIRVCPECLKRGHLDQHSRDVKDSRIKI